MNKKIKKRILRNLKIWKENLMLGIDQDIKSIEDSKNIQELMNCKSILLNRMVSEIPLGDDTCYFCQAQLIKGQGLTCEKCEYAKIHGMCIDDKNSTFERIANHMNNLHNLLNYYARIK